MYPYLGDFPTGKTIFFPFQTFNSSGASVTLTGLAVTDIEVYKSASMTQRSSDAGYALVDTDGIDLDGITGIHGFTIDTSDNTDASFYAAGNDYIVVVSAVTVDSQTVNFIAGAFSIDNRGLLRPTTASRTLDVTATGAAGIDWGNIENPTTAVNLSGTNIDVDQVVASVSGAVGSVTGAVGSVTGDVGGNVTGSVGSIATGGIVAGSFAADSITAAKLAADVTTELQSGLATAASLTTVAGYLDTEIAAILADTNELQTDWANGGRLDLILDSAASAGDPWSTALPGAYAVGTAGHIVGNSATVAGTLSGTHSSTTCDLGTNAPSQDISGQTIFFPGHNVSRVIDSYATGTGVATFSPSVAVTLANADEWILFPTPPASTGSPPSVLLAANALTAAALATDAVTEIQSGLATSAALATAATYIDTEVAAILADTNELQTDWANGGRLDLLLDGAASAGDPWTTALPGAYTAGQAGYIVGTNVNATVSSRASQTSVDTVDDFLDTEVAAIKAKTDSLTFTVSGQVDANIQSINDTAIVGNGSGTPWGPA
jgi:hypothetical protein